MNHPFDIGIIQKVFKAKHSDKIMIQVRVMMRPENVGMPWLDVVKQASKSRLSYKLNTLKSAKVPS